MKTKKKTIIIYVGSSGSSDCPQTERLVVQSPVPPDQVSRFRRQCMNE